MTGGARPRVLLVRNSRESGPRRLSTWLEEFGIEPVERCGEDGLPETPDGFDGVVLLGGGLMPDDFERAPWLRTERRLAEAVILRDLPTLGICLGAQLIAEVAGGEVRAAFGPKERGSTRIRTTAAGRADPVLASLGASAPMIENHEDMITRLPPGAVLLASSEAVAHQAFRVGEHVRGVQFHPEAGAEHLVGWDDAALREEGLDLAALVGAAVADDHENTSAARDLAAAFAREVRERAAANRSGRVALAEAALEAAFEAHPVHRAPAALAAVFDADGVLAWRAAGVPGRGATATRRDTVFRVASMTKSFLAAAALALRDDGLLDLDAPIGAYVPGIRFSYDGVEQSVTIRQLLANRSGLPEDNAWGDRRLGDSRDEIAAAARSGLRLSAEPGDRYQYSNLGMSFVGRAIERVTGRDVATVISERFIDPLGLSRTSWEPAGAATAEGYRTFDEGASFVPEPYAGHGALACIGGLFSSVDDIARWARFLVSAFGEDPVMPEALAPASRREMQRPHTPVPIPEEDPQRDLAGLAYGMGLFVEQDRRYGRVVQHSGGLPGFSSHMRWHVASGLGSVAFGNSDAFEAGRLATRALDEVLRLAHATPASGPVWPAAADAAVRIDRRIRAGEPFSSFAGLFAENVLMDVPASVRERELAAALDRVGGIAEPQPLFAARTAVSDDPSELSWRIACERGALRCSIRLIGLPEPLVQRLSVTPDPESIHAKEHIEP